MGSDQNEVSCEGKLTMRDLNINTVIQGPYQSSLATMHIEKNFMELLDKNCSFLSIWQVLALNQNSNNLLYMKIILLWELKHECPFNYYRQKKIEGSSIS